MKLDLACILISVEISLNKDRGRNSQFDKIQSKKKSGSLLRTGVKTWSI